MKQAFVRTHYKVESQKWIISVKFSGACFEIFWGLVRACFENPWAFFCVDNLATVLTMDVQVKIWDLPGIKEQAIIFLQDKGLLPKTKNCTA